MALRLGAVFASIRDSIGAETTQTSVSINSFRRSLQREHLRKMITLVIRDGAAPEDARSLARHNLTLLRTRLRAAAPNAASVETRAHVNESIARIDEVLSAQM